MFSAALQVDPHNIPSLFHLGLMQHKNGDHEDALKSFTNALFNIAK